jgi:hypothetical protein
MFDLDHVFVGTTSPRTDEATLAEFGILFSQRRVHLGQGTANACAVFDNAFLELLYAHDMDDLRSDCVRPLGLDERIRWQETGACPFGICFRVTAENSVPASWPFATWGYRAKYLPPGVTIPIGTLGGAFNEPLVFLSPQSRKSAPTNGSEETPHGHALRTLTSVKVRCPAGSSSLSPGINWFRANGFISVEESAEYLLELEFNDGLECQSHRFPKSLPLRLCW